jgi:asparagine synthetase B (glutamine-hydrolysing)
VTAPESTEQVRGDVFQARRVQVFDAGGQFAALGDSSGRRSLSAFGLCLGLRFGFVPSPYSLWRDQYVAAPGELLEIDDGALRTRLEVEPGARRVEPQVCDLEEGARLYLEALIAALSSVIAERPGARLVFMQSAGKDSSVIAKALSELVRRGAGCVVQPVTYEAGIRESEGQFVRARNRSLGLPAPLVVQQSVDVEWRLLQEVCQRADNVVGDLALGSYLRCLDAVECGPGDIVLDGLGADLYLGVGVSRGQRALLALARGWGAAASLGGRCLSFRLAYALDRVDFLPAEQVLAGNRLTARELGQVFPEPYLDELRVLAADLDAQAGSRDDLCSWRTNIFRQPESNCAMEKARLASSAFGAEVLFPLASAGVTKVAWRLDPALRLQRHPTLVNKPVMRHLLEGAPGDEYISRSKGSFRWNVAKFADSFGARMVSQIASMSGEFSGAEQLVRRLDAIRNEELRARKLYLAWIYFRWAQGALDRGAANAVDWSIPNVEIVT